MVSFLFKFTPGAIFRRMAMIRRFRFSVLIPLVPSLLFAFPACAPRIGPATAPGGPPPCNVIFLIGDGMGNSIVSAARIRKGGADGRLRMDEMPVIGLVRTSSANSLITDSAAAATALACGFKTTNETVALTPDGKKTRTILEAALARGMAGGLVVTSSLTDATPAGFGSHVSSRWQNNEIAAELLQTGADLLLGGGYAYFIPKSRKGSSRVDERDLVDEAKNAGYAVCRTKEEMAAASGEKIIGLFADKNMDSEPSLAEMTAEALRRLDGRKPGFFLVVEGSLIDKFAHDNLLEKVLDQTLHFDEAVGTALDFAKKNGRTLVVVTADHETGGLSINGGTLDGSVLLVSWGSDYHNGATVPLFAFGPGARHFTGFKDNTDIPRIFARLLGLADYPKILE